MTQRYAYEGRALHTPAQALYDFLQTTGWVQNKRQFADLLGIDAGNVYNYLAPLDRKHRISATMETLRKWCATVAMRTEEHARVSFIATARGEIEMEAEGFDRTGRPVEPRRYRTLQAAPMVPPKPQSVTAAG